MHCFYGLSLYSPRSGPPDPQRAWHFLSVRKLLLLPPQPAQVKTRQWPAAESQRQRATARPGPPAQPPGSSASPQVPALLRPTLASISCLTKSPASFLVSRPAPQAASHPALVTKLFALPAQPP